MPGIGTRNPNNPNQYWNGTAWVDSTKGSKKTGEQVAGELGFKGKMAKDLPAKDTGTESLADKAARARAKTAEQQAEAVEEEAKKRKKEQQ